MNLTILQSSLGPGLLGCTKGDKRRREREVVTGRAIQGLNTSKSLNLSLNLGIPEDGGVRRFDGHRHGWKRLRAQIRGFFTTAT